MKKLLLTLTAITGFLNAFSWGNDVLVHSEPVGRPSLVATSNGTMYCSVPSGISGQRGINILQSTDLGATWSLVTNLSNGQLVAKSKLVVTGTDSVYCAYQQGSSLYFYSLQSHTRSSYTIRQISDFDVAASPNSNSLYLFTDESGTDFLYYNSSTDGGHTWTGSSGNVSVNAAQPRVSMDGDRLILNYFGPPLTPVTTSDIRTMVFDETAPGTIQSGGFFPMVSAGLERSMFASCKVNDNVWFVYTEGDTLTELKYRLSTLNGSSYGPETSITGGGTTSIGCFDITSYKNQNDSGMYLVYFSQTTSGQAEMKFLSVSSATPTVFSSPETFNDFTPECTDDDTYPAVTSILQDAGVVFFERDAGVASLYYDIRTTTLRTPEIENEQSLSLFPNPIQSELSIQIKNPDLESLCRITDITGRVLKVVELQEKITTVDLSDFVSGVYFLDLDGREVSRFIKE